MHDRIVQFVSGHTTGSICDLPQRRVEPLMLKLMLFCACCPSSAHLQKDAGKAGTANHLFADV